MDHLELITVQLLVQTTVCFVLQQSVSLVSSRVLKQRALLFVFDVAAVNQRLHPNSY